MQIIDTIFTNEWYSKQSKLAQKDFTLDQIKESLYKFAASHARIDEIRQLIGKNADEPINWRHIAENVGIVEIVNSYSGRAERNLERWESKLKSYGEDE